MSQSLTIRPATAADSEALARVRMLSWQTAYRGLMPDRLLDDLDLNASADRFRERLEADTSPDSDGPWNAARDHLCIKDGRIMGWSSWGPTRDEVENREQTAELYALYVLPEFFGLGAGHLLMESVLTEIRTKGVYEAVSLWVLHNNTRGTEFYVRQGFAPDGTEKTDPIGPDFVARELRFRKVL